MNNYDFIEKSFYDTQKTNIDKKITIHKKQILIKKLQYIFFI